MSRCPDLGALWTFVGFLKLIFGNIQHECKYCIPGEHSDSLALPIGR